jgi:hypothetical protein
MLLLVSVGDSIGGPLQVPQPGEGLGLGDGELVSHGFVQAILVSLVGDCGHETQGFGVGIVGAGDVVPDELVLVPFCDPEPFWVVVAGVC